MKNGNAKSAVRVSPLLLTFFILSSGLALSLGQGQPFLGQGGGLHHAEAQRRRGEIADGVRGLESVVWHSPNRLQFIPDHRMNRLGRARHSGARRACQRTCPIHRYRPPAVSTHRKTVFALERYAMKAADRPYASVPRAARTGVTRPTTPVVCRARFGQSASFAVKIFAFSAFLAVQSFPPAALTQWTGDGFSESCFSGGRRRGKLPARWLPHFTN